MKLRITVDGVSYDVDVEILDENGGGQPALSSSPAPLPQAQPAAQPARPAPAAAAPPVAVPEGDGSDCRSPLSGSVLDVRVKPGDKVALNQVLMVLEAMKMEANIASPVAGTVKAVHAHAGDTVREGQVLVEFE